MVSEALDSDPSSWREHLEMVRNITASLELQVDSAGDKSREQWQITFISVFQRVAYSDADNGGVPDVGNWCLRQALRLLQAYPEDVSLLSSKSVHENFSTR